MTESNVAGLQGPIDLSFVGGPLDGQQRRFEDVAPTEFEDNGARYKLDLYMRDYRLIESRESQPAATSVAAEVSPPVAPPEPEKTP